MVEIVKTVSLIMGAIATVIANIKNLLEKLIAAIYFGLSVNSLLNALRNFASPEKMMGRNKININDYTIMNITGDFVLAHHKFIPTKTCAYCIFGGDGGNNKDMGCRNMNSDGSGYVYVPFGCTKYHYDDIFLKVSEFPPERLAKFRLTGEDDG